MVSIGLRNVRGSTIIIATAIAALLFLPLTASTNSNTLLQPQSVFAQQQQEEAGFIPYLNPIHGIFMQYPSNWTASTSGLTDYTDLIAFYSPLQNLSDSSPAWTHDICDNLWSECITSRIYRLGVNDVESIPANKCNKFFRQLPSLVIQGIG